MGLYERLMGGADQPFKIPIHQFSSLLADLGRGRITGQQVQDAITLISGAPLTPAEVTEAQTLFGTITGAVTAKLARAKEIDDVLILAETFVPPHYDTPAHVRTRLGV